MKYFIFIILVFSSLTFSQQSNTILVVGDSLIGRNEKGEMIREVIGHVVLNQGKVRITCDRAIQFLSKNNAELIGNVVATQENITITTPKGFYYGNQKRAESISGIMLDDKKVILTAKSGEYFFDEDMAHFVDSVKLYDTTTTLTSNEMIYFQKENRMISMGNVQVVDNENVIKADSLEYHRYTKITFAFNNVSISNSVNNLIIYGDHLEDYDLESKTIIDKNPLLIQFDTTFVTSVDSVSGDTIQTATEDTLLIKSMFMEAWRDTINKFIAIDSVRILRKSFASKNDYTLYLRNENKILTYKAKANDVAPVLWYDNSQLSGDSVAIFLTENKIKSLEVYRNAFILSQSLLYPQRFDQIAGEKVIIDFAEQGIDKTDVFGNVLSIYYMYEQDEPNGLTKSSSQTASIRFEDKKVSEVRLYGSPMSEFHPENMVTGKETSFVLPQYVFFEDRPVKQDFLIK
ncbi:MAG TPA: OstA-like protein [Ignavibacteriaceae bacterium]|nr:OstA-like protein [Ignavibacteriaceae bacterium]